MTSFDIYQYATDQQIANFKPTFLYLKKHSVTGKFYFGKTTSSYPEKYSGSGSYWSSHIKKHDKRFIETIWYCLFTDIVSLVETAVSLSSMMNIVDSDEFANLRIEDGLDGGSNPKGYTFSRHKETWTEEQLAIHHAHASKGGTNCLQNNLGIFDKSKIDAHTRSKNAAKSALANGNLNIKNNHELYKPKRMASAKANGGNAGVRNPAYGKILIHHDLIGNKRIHPSLYADYYEQGWLVGAIKSDKHSKARLGKPRGKYKRSTIS